MIFRPLIIQPPPQISTPGVAMLLVKPQAVAGAVEASITQARFGNITTATASTSLNGVIYYYWYLDGLYVGVTTSAMRSFALTAGETARIDCLASNSADFDPIANAPDAWPSRRMVVFTRSLDDTTVKYLIEQQAGGGSWSPIAKVKHDPRTWLYQVMTPPLADLTQYAWRVTPYNAAGQAGSVITLASEMIVRTPDAPDFSFTFNPGTLEVTFAAA